MCEPLKRNRLSLAITQLCGPADALNSCPVISELDSGQSVLTSFTSLWPPCVADADIIFLPCGFFLFSIFFFIPCLISAAAD